MIILIGLNKKQIKDLPNNIIGITQTQDVNELRDIYSVADVYVNPTVEDNFPTTNLEALACGTPVITYNTGGSIEAVSESTGIIVEKGDMQGLVNAIETVRKNGKEYYSNNCHERAVRLYNRSDRYMDYINLYTQILNKDNKNV
jgi:glycosyltransferase involved in cell wall biosynthesis